MRELDFEFTARRSNKWVRFAVGLGVVSLVWPAQEIWRLSQQIESVRQDIQRQQAAAASSSPEDGRVTRQREERKRIEALLKGTLDARLTEMERCFGSESATLTVFQHDEATGLTTAEAHLSRAEAAEEVMHCLNADDLPVGEPRWALRTIRAAAGGRDAVGFDISLRHQKRTDGGINP